MQQNQGPVKAYILHKKLPYQVQNENTQAAKTVASMVRTCLGPNAMQKMVMTRIGSIELTNDGNAILREVEMAHPAAKSLVELARTQDDEVGDGTTSVIILASEILNKTFELIDHIHPIKITHAMGKALNICTEGIKNYTFDIKKDDEEIKKIIKSALGTKICSILKVPIEDLALKVVKTIYNEEYGVKRVDLKNDIRVEKLLGSNNIEAEILDGIIIEKTIYHPEMRRNITNPRILVVDTPLEYKKGESQTNFEFRNPDDFKRALEIEEEQVKKMCELIIEFKPDIVLSEKGISDFALSILQENNITAIRRIKKTEANRLVKACGGSIVSRLENISEKSIGKNCGSFDYLKINNDYFCKFSKCSKPRACSIILRAHSKDLLNELERNFYDAVKVARNVFLHPKMVVGGGSIEMALSQILEKSKGTEIELEVYKKLSEALKIIPMILAKNSGHLEPLSLVAELEKKIKDCKTAGIDGIKGVVVDMKNIVAEPMVVKTQMLKSSIEAASLLLRVDGIIQSTTNKESKQVQISDNCHDD